MVGRVIFCDHSSKWPTHRSAISPNWPTCKSANFESRKTVHLSEINFPEYVAFWGYIFEPISAGLASKTWEIKALNRAALLTPDPSKNAFPRPLLIDAAGQETSVNDQGLSGHKR